MFGAVEVDQASFLRRHPQEIETSHFPSVTLLYEFTVSGVVIEMTPTTSFALPKK
jgi:hypothetical protein